MLVLGSAPPASRQQRRDGDLRVDVVGLVAGGRAGTGRPVLYLAEERRGLLGSDRWQLADGTRVDVAVGLTELVAKEP